MKTEKPILDLTNLWGAVRREAAAELSLYRSAQAEFWRVAADVEPILSNDQLLREEVESSTCAAEILERTAKYVDCVMGKSIASTAALRLKRIEQQKVFAAVPALLAVARKVAQRAKAAVIEASNADSKEFGVPCRPPSHLLTFVDQFEREIINVERQMLIMSHQFSPPIIPQMLSVFDEPKSFIKKPILPEGVPITAVHPHLRIVAISIAEQQRQAQADADLPNRRAAQLAKKSARLARLSNLQKVPSADGDMGEDSQHD